MHCNITGLGTHLKVKNIEKSRSFYESLGFQSVFGYGDEAFRETFPEDVTTVPEQYRGIVFKVGDSATLEIAEGHVGLPQKYMTESSVFSEAVLSPKVSAMIQVESLLPLFVNNLVDITFPVRKYYWGTLEAAFRDPDGYVLVFIAPATAAAEIALAEHTTLEVMMPSQ